jgi:hypothetical protein
MNSQDRREEIKQLLCDVKKLATRYYNITKKPLGVTGEIAELEAAEKLGLELAEARCPGFDATSKAGEKFQIKGRAVSVMDKYRGRMPSINCDGEFDAVLLVLLDRESFDLLEIWRVERAVVKERLEAPGSKARNELGSMGIAQFKSKASKAEKVWPLQQHD